MPRDGEKIRRKLQKAALELYLEQGFEPTTAAEIAIRAGVTERTFFRHFADKRDVMFTGESVLRDQLMAAVSRAPAELGPGETLLYAFRSAEHLFVENRPFSEPRHRLIENSPTLQERALAKVRVVITGLTDALRERGIPSTTAALAAQLGMTALNHAVACWFCDGSRGLSDHLLITFDELRDLFAFGSGRTSNDGGLVQRSPRRCENDPTVGGD